MAPLKLNFRMGSTSRSTSQEEPPAAAAGVTNGIALATKSGSTASGIHSTTSITESSSPSMEFEGEHQARGDRSALLQQGAYYPNTNHLSQNQQEHIAYDNPTAQRDQIEREEIPSTSLQKGATPLSPPPSYEHVLHETHLYARDGSSTSHGCPHHSPQSSQLSESDGESQYMEQCCCQLRDPTMQQMNECHNMAGPSHSSSSAAAAAAAIDTDTITLEASDTYPEEIFTAWHQSTGQRTGEIEISNKCSKQLYKLMAAEGICKMSSECRCDECQSHYFDCDFDNNEHQKTDGGLGAGTPMFINEVMHGAACNIL